MLCCTSVAGSRLLSSILPTRHSKPSVERTFVNMSVMIVHLIVIVVIIILISACIKPALGGNLHVHFTNKLIYVMYVLRTTSTRVSQYQGKESYTALSFISPMHLLQIILFCWFKSFQVLHLMFNIS